MKRGIVDDPDAAPRIIGHRESESGDTNGVVPVASDDNWIKSHWRPLMGYTYILICICDFILFPMGWALLSVMVSEGGNLAAWVPLTLSQGGLFHMAMGAVLGVAAWSRGQEKIKRY